MGPLTEDSSKTCKGLLDLPHSALVTIVTRCDTHVVHQLAQACKLTHELCHKLYALHAVARAVRHPAHPGRKYPTSLQRLLDQVPCSTPAVHYLHTWAPQAEQVLLRPDLAAWVLRYAGKHNDWRVVNWLLAMDQPYEAVRRRHAYHALVDRCWMEVVGLAAACHHTALLQALLDMPSAPGKEQGLRMLPLYYQSLLLAGAVAGSEPRQALELVMPLCCLRTPKDRPRWPWEPEGQQQEEEAIRAQALKLAAEAAAGRGYKLAGVLPALMAQGLQLNYGTVARILQQAVSNNRAACIKAMMQLEVPPEHTPSGTPQPLHTAYYSCVSSTFSSALATLKLDCVLAMLDVLPSLLSCTSLKGLLTKKQPAAVQVLLGHKEAVSRLPEHSLCRVLAAAAAGPHPAVMQQLVGLGAPLTEEVMRSVWCHSDALVGLLETVAQPGPHSAVKLPLAMQVVASFVEAKAREHAQLRAGGHPQDSTYSDWAKSLGALARAVHLMLEWLVQHSDCPQLQQAYLGHVCDKHEKPVLVAGWAQLVQALCHIGLRRLARVAFEHAPCDAKVMVSEYGVLVALATISAATKEASPQLLRQCVERGARPAEVLRAAFEAQGPHSLKLLTHVLHMLQQQQRAAVAAAEEAWGGSNQQEEDDLSVWLHAAAVEQFRVDLADEQGGWADEMVQSLASTACSRQAQTGHADAALPALKLLLTAFHARPCAARLTPMAACTAHSRRHYMLLRWLLAEFGVARVMRPVPSRVYVAPSERLQLAPLQEFASYSPLPFVTLLLEHGADSNEVLAGLCSRQAPPLHFIRCMLDGHIPVLAREQRLQRPGRSASTAQAADSLALARQAVHGVHLAKAQRQCSAASAQPLKAWHATQAHKHGADHMSASNRATRKHSGAVDGVVHLAAVGSVDACGAKECPAKAPATTVPPPAAEAIQTPHQQQQQVGSQPRRLLGGPCDVNWGNGELLVRVLTAGGSQELLDLLLERGVDWRTALQRGVMGATDGRLIAHLLQQQVQNSVDNNDAGAQQRPLDHALLCGLVQGCSRNWRVLASVVAHGCVDVNELLVCAAKVGAVGCAKSLLEVYGADPSYMLQQPVIMAAEKGHVTLVELLLLHQGHESAACPHAALYGAALGGHEDLARMLMSAFEADPHWEDGAALNAAISNGHEPVANLLLQ